MSFLTLFTSCDPDGKKKCDWVIEPEPELMGKTEGNLIPICARNRVTQKQDCRLQSTLEYAEANKGKKFRYVDMVVENYGIPRTIKSIKFCD